MTSGPTVPAYTAFLDLRSVAEHLQALGQYQDQGLLEFKWVRFAVLVGDIYGCTRWLPTDTADHRHGPYLRAAGDDYRQQLNR